MGKGTRRVIVNVNPRGKIHELTCRWLKGALDSGGLNPTSYQEMPESHVPVGKKHCSHC